MLNRTIAPPFVKSASFQLPSPTTIDLSNGVKLHVIDGVQQDIIKIECVFRSGKWFESKIGQSHFTAQMIERGSATKTSAQLAEFFDYYGAHIEISPGLDFTSIALYSLTKNLHQVLPGFMEMLKTPTFPEHELKHMKDVFIENLKVNNEKSSFLASKALRRNLFGLTHPYGNSIEPNDVKSLNSDDLRNFFESHMNPSEVFIVSKSNMSTLDYLAEIFSSFPKNKRAIQKSLDMSGSNVFFEKINKANSVQSSVRLGKKTISRPHHDYFDLLFINHVLGGYFGSRLMKNIREEKGLTYGIQSSVNSLMHESFMAIGADVNKENEELIFKEIEHELVKLQSQEIEESELNAAKGHFIGGLQSETSNPFSVAEKVKAIKLFSLPANHYQNLVQRVDSVTPSELINVANTYLKGDTFFKVAVG